MKLTLSGAIFTHLVQGLIRCPLNCQINSALHRPLRLRGRKPKSRKLCGAKYWARRANVDDKLSVARTTNEGASGGTPDATVMNYSKAWAATLGARQPGDAAQPLR